MAQNVINKLNSTSISKLTFEPMELEAEQIIEGDPKWEWALVWQSEDKRIAAVAFKSTEGKFRADTPLNEFITLLDGRMSVTGPDGEKFECGPGDFIQVEPGREYVYEVLEPITDYVVMVSDEAIEF
jgi:uncharacterized cupin superfamily protein